MMQNCSRAVELMQRPLLYIFGGFVAAAGVCYYVKKRGNVERRRTCLSQDSEDDSLLDPVLISDVDGVSVTHNLSAAPAEVEVRVRKLEELLCEAHTECERKNKECSIAKNIVKFMKLQTKKQESFYMRKKTLLKVSLAKSGKNYRAMMKKYEEAMNINQELKNKNSDLISDLNTVKNALRNLEEELTNTKRRCDKPVTIYMDKTERNDQDMKEKYEEAMKINDQLENKNSDLILELGSVRNSLRILVKELAEARSICDETMMICLDKADRNFQDMKKEYEEAMKINHQLENKNSDLILEFD